jgi:hypothetical protein
MPSRQIGVGGPISSRPGTGVASFVMGESRQRGWHRRGGRGRTVQEGSWNSSSWWWAPKFQPSTLAWWGHAGQRRERASRTRVFAGCTCWRNCLSAAAPHANNHLGSSRHLVSQRGPLPSPNMSPGLNLSCSAPCLRHMHHRDGRDTTPCRRLWTKHDNGVKRGRQRTDMRYVHRTANGARSSCLSTRPGPLDCTFVCDVLRGHPWTRCRRRPARPVS